MPYITRKDRTTVNRLLDNILDYVAEGSNAGELNYILTKILLAWNPTCYQDYCDIIGTLECVKLEMYRRRIAGYEDTKIEQNGDVYFPDKLSPTNQEVYDGIYGK